MAGTGGSITVLWDAAGAGSVSITGPGTFKVDGEGSDLSFPVAIAAATNYVTPADGPHTVTVTYKGQTVLEREFNINAGAGVVLQPGWNGLALTALDDLAAITPEYSTTTALADIDSAINTEGKFTGKQVYNTTTGILVLADGPDADDKWAESDGTDEHTPV